jgi:CelD/BcsL family acetyltransferase involved in cellulose biosynthesis
MGSENLVLANKHTETSRQMSAISSAAEVARFHDNGHEYRLACLVVLEELKNIRDAWQGLESKNRDSFVYFQRYDWCYQWCVHHLAADAVSREMQLRVYVLQSAGAIVMIWPMAIVKSRAGARILVSLSDPLAQYSNILADRNRVSENAGRKVWDLICRHAGVDAITLNNFPAGSFLDRIICGRGYLERSNRAASILDLTSFETWQEHEASLSRSTRKHRKRRRAKLEKAGEIAYEVVPGGTDRYREIVQQTLEMKRSWLEFTGRSSSAISSDLTEGFLASLTGREQNAAGVPEGAFTHALTLNDKPIATEIALVMGKHHYSFLGAFDLDWQSYSPGKVQIESAQQWAKDVGLSKFDFLGDPSGYKSYWAGTEQPLASRAIPLTGRGMLYCRIWKSLLRPALKSAYANMSPNGRRIVTNIAANSGVLSGKQEPAQSGGGAS